MAQFYPVAMHLCAMQVGYEMKSCIDVLSYGDGVLFLVHHMMASSLAVLAFNPYCQLYANFFLGVSEVP